METQIYFTMKKYKSSKPKPLKETQKETLQDIIIIL
jgi:hypothetical protein